MFAPDGNDELDSALANLSLLVEPGSPVKTETRTERPTLRLKLVGDGQKTTSELVVDTESPATKNIQVDQFYAQARQLLGDRAHDVPTVTVIVAGDAYLHEFSRPWVGKKYLATVVERPERLLAASLGIGAAMMQTQLLVERAVRRTPLSVSHVTKVHGEPWVKKLYELCGKTAEKHAGNELEVPEDWPSGDIYLGSGTAAALENAVGAVEQGIDGIFSSSGPRRAFVAVRPPGHHCHRDAASGFCLINNVHIAIQYAHATQNITHAVIFDFDLHHGDGSQDLCWKLGFSNDEEPSVRMGYFSVHDIQSFPTETGYATPEMLSAASTCLLAHGTAIWNVHLQQYESEEEFNGMYEEIYSQLFVQAAKFLRRQEAEAKEKCRPFLPLILVSAGFDGSEYESQAMQRHGVHVPTSFFNRFTRDCGAVADRFASGRMLSLMEGGYSVGAVASGTMSHLLGMADTPWDPEWLSASEIKEFEKGCKAKWRKPSSESWLVGGVQLGRALFPVPEPIVIPPRQLRSRTLGF